MSDPVSSITLVDTAAIGLGKCSNVFPSVFWSAFAKMHEVRWWWHQKELYSKEENRGELGAGHAVNYILGSNPLFRKATRALLISTRIIECVDQKAIFSESYGRWLDTVKGYYPSFEIPTGKKALHNSFLNYSISSRLDKIVTYAMQVIIATHALFQEGFILSMHMISAQEALSLNSNSKREATTEIFINARKCLNKLAASEEDLLQSLKENRTIMKLLFPDETDEWIETLTSCIQTAAKAQKSVQALSDHTNEVIYDYLRRTGYQLISIFGKQFYKFVPRPYSPKWYAAKANERSALGN